MILPTSPMTTSFLVILVTTAWLTQGEASPPNINTNHQRFADNLTASLYTPDSNECTSSWGVSMALSLVYPGADELGAQQMRDVLGFPGDESQLSLVWNGTASRLDTANNGRCQWGDYDEESCGEQVPTLEIANSVWLDDGDTLVSAYHEVVGTFARQIDFDNEGAGGEVNSWVEEKTNGLIDSIIDEGTIEGFLLAINSIYLKASWAFPFLESRTNEDSFYSSASRSAALDNKAHFMHKVEEFQYSHEALPGFQILQLPFNGHSLSMVFVLPRSDEAGLATSSDVLAALPDLERTRVAVGLPKFKFESQYEDDLMASLQSLGLTEPFAGGLCGLVEGRCGFIDLIIQKTVIDVHEKGVEAAAVTLVRVDKGRPREEPDPILFLADHPVQFFIYDREEDLVLFEGRLVDPGIASNVPIAELEAVHSDDNFWLTYFRVTPKVLPPVASQSVSNPDPSPGSTDEPTVSVDSDPSIGSTVNPGKGASSPTINTNHQRFADNLTASLYTPDSNECTSSWGVSMALSLVYPGADELGAQQMRDVLGFPGDESQLSLVWNGTASRLDTANNGRCQWGDYDEESCGEQVPTLEIANSVWLDDGDTLVSAYHEVVGTFARQIDFDNEGAGGEVNSWVEEKTNGLIDSIIDEGTIEYFLLAINSIYLKASWAFPFSEYYTNEDSFYSSASRSAALDNKAHFMHMVEEFQYSHEALHGFQILQLPFNGHSLSMVFVLPRSDEAGLATSSDVLAALPDLERTRVAVGLPKFKFESQYEDDLKASLQSLGLTEPFVRGLCGLVEGRCGFIDLIIQKTVIDVHEKGVEAAAVTMVAVLESAPVEEPEDPILFLADHPVQFFIYDREEDLVLFEGRLVDPGIASDAPSAVLQSVLSNGDFWGTSFGVTPKVLPPVASQSVSDSNPSPGSTVEPTVPINSDLSSGSADEPTVQLDSDPSPGSTVNPAQLLFKLLALLLLWAL